MQERIFVTYKPWRKQGRKAYQTGLGVYPDRWRWLKHLSPTATAAMSYGFKVKARLLRSKESEA